MAQIRWTQQAADDLEAIAEFIAQDSPEYASLFAIDILAAVERIGVFTHIGRVVPEMDNPLVREVILGDYRIVYRGRKNVVDVLTIWHGARLLDPSRLG